jgi:hypothetical protein
MSAATAAFTPVVIYGASDTHVIPVFVSTELGVVDPQSIWRVVNGAAAKKRN